MSGGGRRMRETVRGRRGGSGKTQTKAKIVWKTKKVETAVKGGKAGRAVRAEKVSRESQDPLKKWSYPNTGKRGVECRTGLLTEECRVR